MEKKGKEEIFADNFFSILQNLNEIGREIEAESKNHARNVFR